MQAIRAFMGAIVDYAGLFPPAKLEMRAVVENYARYRLGPHAWILGRLICPVGRFDELSECLDAVAGDQRAATWPWHVAALGKEATDPAAALVQLGDDLAIIDDFNSRLAGRVVIDVYESKLPLRLIMESGTSDPADFAAAFSAGVGGHKATSLTPYLELTMAGDWTRTIPATIAALARQNEDALCTRDTTRPEYRPLGVKIRTGGLEAAMFPSAEQVACVIGACHRHGLSFKATAGLHHPLRHFNASVGARMHGFLNVFGAAILTHARRLHADALHEMLAEENPDSFRFDNDGFAWTSRRATTAEIRDAREQFAASFGSCSFEEPIEDLERLGLL